MKIRFYLALAAAALVMTNCSKDEEVVNGTTGTKSFTATIEGASRSSVNPTSGVFEWTAGDKISVWNGETFDVYANSTADVNNFVAESNDAGNATGYAIYPAGGHKYEDGTVTVNLPDEYTYGSTNAPMLASIEGANLSFKHLAGVMRFVVKNVPVGASKFVFTATNDIITGEYNVVGNQIVKDGEGVVNNNNSVTITFDEVATEMEFYVPLPVGTYGAYTVAIQSEDGTTVNLVNNESTNVSNTIGRRTLLLMPEFTVNGATLEKGKGNTIAVTEGEASVSGNQSLTIDTENAGQNATIQLKYTPQEGNATLSVTDGCEENTDPTTSVATLKIEPQGSESVETLNINTPTLTVELGAGTYETVNALTATETLIIGADVTINTLVLNGGKLNVTDGAEITEIVVKDAEAFKAAWGKCSKITLANDVDLALTQNYELTVESGKEISINLNTHKLTTSSDETMTALDEIKVEGILKVTGEGEIATVNTIFYVDGGDLTLENCTLSAARKYATVYVIAEGHVTAKNVTANVFGTAFLAKDGSTMELTGCNVTKTGGGEYTVVTVDNGTLIVEDGEYTSVENEASHDLSYVIGVKGGANATINTTVSGGNGGVTVIGASTANLTGGSYTGVKACGLYVNGNSTVTYENCTFSGVEGDVVVGSNGGTVNGTPYTAYTKIQ